MPNFREKIKHFKEYVTVDRVFMPVLIVLVGTASFGLGRLSTHETSRNRPIQITPPETEEPKNNTAAAAKSIAPQKQDTTASEQDGKVVGSKNGTKYHLPWCSGAQRIAEANKVWFDSIEAAKAAGYTPAANCKGLE